MIDFHDPESLFHITSLENVLFKSCEHCYFDEKKNTKKTDFVFYFLGLLLIDDSISTQCTTCPNMKDCQNKDINTPEKNMVKTCLLPFFLDQLEFVMDSKKN